MTQDTRLVDTIVDDKIEASSIEADSAEPAAAEASMPVAEFDGADSSALRARLLELELLCKEQKDALDYENEAIGAIDELIYRMTEWSLNDLGRSDIRELMRRYGYNIVYDSVESAFANYPTHTNQYWQEAFSRVADICYDKIEKTCRDCMNFQQIEEYRMCWGIEYCPDEAIDEQGVTHCSACMHYGTQRRMSVIGTCLRKNHPIVRGRRSCGHFNR